MYDPERYTRGSKFNRRTHDRPKLTLAEAIILVTAGIVLGATIVVIGLPI